MRNATIKFLLPKMLFPHTALSKTGFDFGDHMCARPPPTADAVAPGGVVVCVPTGGRVSIVRKSKSDGPKRAYR